MSKPPTHRTFQSYDQKVKDLDDPQGMFLPKLSIHLWCFDEFNESCLVRIEDYYYSFYVQIPDILYDVDKLHVYIDKLCWYLAPNRYHDNNYMYSSCGCEDRKPFYYYTNGTRPHLLFKFSSVKAMRFASKRIREGVNMGRGEDPISCAVLEEEVHNINPCLKFHTECGIAPGEWFTFGNDETGVANFLELEDEYKLSNVDEYIVPYKALRKLDDGKMRISRPMTLSYDIETYSDIDTAFPNAMNDEDACYMIGCTFERLGLPDTRKKLCLYIGETPNILTNDTSVNTSGFLPCKTEKELLLKFFELIKEYNAILIIGYNIGNFDNDYISNRCYNTNARPITPTLYKQNHKPRFIVARSEQVNVGTKGCNLFTIGGRISIDVYTYMLRVYPSLTKHSLEFVSQHFIDEGKNDMPYKEMFKIYRESRIVQLTEEYALGSMKLSTLSEIESEWAQMPSVPPEGKAHIRKRYIDVIRYAEQDTVLPLKLMNKLDIWTAQIEMSKLMIVSLETLLTQGEQVRSYSQLYNMLHTAGFVLEFLMFKGMQCNGGYVGEPLAGKNFDEFAFDFASLYPSLMQEYNISYDTLVKDEDLKSGLVSWDDVNRHDYTQEECVMPPGQELPKKHTALWKANTKIVHYTRYLVKPEVHEGQLPILMRSLLTQRKSRRAQGKEYMKKHAALAIYPVGHPDHDNAINTLGDEYLLYASIFEAQQLSMKVSMNAVYGTLKVNYGAKISFPYIAQLITAKGRQAILLCNDYLSYRLYDLMATVPASDVPDVLHKYKLDDKSTYDTRPIPTFAEIKNKDERTAARTGYVNTQKYTIDNKGGIIVYNDTDSVYCRFPWINREDIQGFGDFVQKTFKNIFTKVLVLEFEQAFYVIVHIMKKMYTAVIMDTKTCEPLTDPKTKKWMTYTRGLCIVKRDCARIQRDMLSDVSYNIMSGFDSLSTLEIIFNYIMRIINRDVTVEDVSNMVTMGEEYALESYPMNVFKDSLSERGKNIRGGEKVEFCMCQHATNSRKLLSKGLRDDSIRLGRVYWLTSEIAAGESTSLDYFLILDKISSRIDDFFSNVFGSEKALQDIYISRNRGKTDITMTTPCAFFSTLVYNLEEDFSQCVIHKAIEGKLSSNAKATEVNKLIAASVAAMSDEDVLSLTQNFSHETVSAKVSNRMCEVINELY